MEFVLIDCAGEVCRYTWNADVDEAQATWIVHLLIAWGLQPLCSVSIGSVFALLVSFHDVLYSFDWLKWRDISAKTEAIVLYNAVNAKLGLGLKQNERNVEFSWILQFFSSKMPHTIRNLRLSLNGLDV